MMGFSPIVDALGLAEQCLQPVAIRGFLVEFDDHPGRDYVEWTEANDEHQKPDEEAPHSQIDGDAR